MLLDPDFCPASNTLPGFASQMCLSVSVAVLAKQVVPTVGYADEDVFLPQWAIAGIVIGLASLLFIIIFGVTVVSNKLILLTSTLLG